MRQSTSIHQQIDHKIRIEGSRMSQELKPVCTKSAGEPILDAHFQNYLFALFGRKKGWNLRFDDRSMSQVRPHCSSEPTS